jgi:hypothetical protein
MALAPMKTLANRFVLDVFVIIERAINGTVNQQRFNHSFYLCKLQAIISKRNLRRHLPRMHGSAALYTIMLSLFIIFKI